MNAFFRALVIWFACWSSAFGGVRFVAANGTDSEGCGSAEHPCRSISQAMTNAEDGDTIYVGPGRYGDLSANGSFSGPGDEQPQVGTGWSPGCIVCIEKPLHIYTQLGASVTFIASGPYVAYSSTVSIRHDGVDFGAAGHGFTITGGNSSGVTVDLAYAGVPVRNNISVAGNVDFGDQGGFGLVGATSLPIGCSVDDCAFSSRILIDNNQALNNSVGGFFVSVAYSGPPGQIIVRNNQSIGAGTGFSVIPWSLFGGDSPATASNVQVLNNVAASGGTGFYINASGPVRYNTAISNAQSGYQMRPGGAAFTDNSAIDNAGPGMLLNFSAEAFSVAPIAFAPFSNNNIFGNDRHRPANLQSNFSFSEPDSSFGSFNPGPGAHCGVLNVGVIPGLFPPLPPVPALQPAPQNYWGSAAGPTASGAGDTLGGRCDQNGGVTTASPPAWRPFPITSNPVSSN